MPWHITFRPNSLFQGEQHRRTAAAGLRISVGSSAMEWSGPSAQNRGSSSGIMTLTIALKRGY